MPHTISVNQPNRPQGDPIETEWGVVPNGSSISVSDERVAVWQVQNPGRELPTRLDHSEAETMREEAINALDEDEATVLREDLERQKGLDLSTESAPPVYSTMASGVTRVETTNEDGDS